ncbi:MAG: protein TolR [Desulfobacteraceae bacterium]|nr:MAG: protein TolR [Desulfobacteraceae bacterium]
MNPNSNQRRYMADINVTPLVDVMLVLLIIFMVTAPMMMQGVDVNLPKTKTTNIKTEEDPFQVSINKKGEIFLESKKIKLEEVEVKIKSIFKYREEKEVLLRADKDIAYGIVIKVLAEINRAGISKVGIVTEPME